MQRNYKPIRFASVSHFVFPFNDCLYCWAHCSIFHLESPLTQANLADAVKLQHANQSSSCCLDTVTLYSLSDWFAEKIWDRDRFQHVRAKPANVVLCMNKRGQYNTRESRFNTVSKFIFSIPRFYSLLSPPYFDFCFSASSSLSLYNCLSLLFLAHIHTLQQLIYNIYIYIYIM